MTCKQQKRLQTAPLAAGSNCDDLRLPAANRYALRYAQLPLSAKKDLDAEAVSDVLPRDGDLVDRGHPLLVGDSPEGVGQVESIEPSRSN